jgi:uncharacterized protein (TIGR02679 family)
MSRRAELVERFGGDLTPVFQVVHDRLSRTGSLGASPLILRGLTSVQRRALAAVLGATVPSGEPVRINPNRLQEALGSSRWEATAEEVAVALCGPVVDRRQAAAELDAERAGRLAVLYAHPLAADPRITAFVQNRAGWLLGFTDHDLGIAFDAVERLSHDPVPRPVLAARSCGDAHALDDDRPAGSVAMALLWARAGGTGARATDAESRRALWESAGSELDAVSSSVLVAGLCPSGGDEVAVALRALASVGLEASLTLRQVARLDPCGLGSLGVVHACENPTVLAVASDHFGPRCPPLVCVSGHGSLAARRLLRALTSAGAEVRYHGDLDPAGLVIAAAVFADGAVSWRFGAVDYLAAIEDAPTVSVDTDIPDTSWDPALAVAMRAHRRGVHEEALLGVLIADLEVAAGDPTTARPGCTSGSVPARGAEPPVSAS